MSQRRQPPFSSESEPGREHGEDCGWLRPAPPKAKRLVMHIAEALHISPAELYKPPAAVRPTCGADSGGVLDQDCEALLYAYKCIRDPRKRQELLALVVDAAEQS